MLYVAPIALLLFDESHSISRSLPGAFLHHLNQHVAQRPQNQGYSTYPLIFMYKVILHITVFI